MFDGDSDCTGKVYDSLADNICYGRTSTAKPTWPAPTPWKISKYCNL